MWFKWLLIGIFLLSTATNIADVGKDQEPNTPLDAVVLFILNAVLIAGILYYWR